MIASIFSKSKPINFIIVFVIVAFAFFIGHYKFIPEPFALNSIFRLIFLLFVGITSVLILNFIVAKNKLTKDNSYDILLYSLFILALTPTTIDKNILLSNFFILLGFRRIMSVRSQVRLNKKFFDAAFWITIAALFYFWSILFFILILISLALYTDNKLNHWLIPFAGVLTVLIILIAFSIILNDSYFGFINNLPEISYDFSSYNSTSLIIAITILLSYGLWSTVFYSINIKQKKKALRPSYKIIIFAVLIGFSIVIFAPNKNGSEFLFMFAPLAIIISNYVQIIKDKWFREVFLLIIILMPFIALML